MNFSKIKSLVLITLLISLSSSVQDTPKILIIGDSISIGYTPFVKKHFEGKAEVFHNSGNAQHTGTGLEKIEEWIGDEDWDIIQINWGLWDLCYRYPDSKVQGNRDKINGQITFPLAEYEQNLDEIVKLIKAKTNAKLIFVTTSYVPEHEAGRFTKDPQKYNMVAKKVMKKHSVIINDIYKSSIPIHHQDGKGNNDVHYNSEGYKKLAALISGFLEKEL
ncbi:Lysophospholipase L1 [Spirosomataceae bacterium TFI 002]|nr:Lysophospholipase L1 [Spirosomataceae bacterium TFI 002]